MEKKMKKILSLSLLLCLCFSAFAIDLPDTEIVNEGLQEFVTGLADSVPAASTMSNLWSDAYVGQLLGIPPHFGVGASAGAAKMDISGIKKAAKELGINAVDKLNDDFILPVASIEAVVGGVFIPFDISGSFMVMDEPIGFSGENSLQYKIQSFNLKLRVPLLKQNIVLPNLSLGVGFARLSGEFFAEVQDINTHINVKYSSDVYSADVQLSKSVIFLTPYVGARILASKSNNLWDYAYTVSSDISGRDEGNYANEEYNINYQLFAGTSFNILVLKLNVNAAYDVKTKVWSAGAGVQIKL